MFMQGVRAVASSGEKMLKSWTTSSLQHDFVMSSFCISQQCGKDKS